MKLERKERDRERSLSLAVSSLLPVTLVKNYSKSRVWLKTISLLNPTFCFRSLWKRRMRSVKLLPFSSRVKDENETTVLNRSRKKNLINDVPLDVAKRESACQAEMDSQSVTDR